MLKHPKLSDCGDESIYLTYISLIGNKTHNFILVKYFPSLILSNLGSNGNISIVPLRFWLYEEDMGNTGVFLTYPLTSKKYIFICIWGKNRLWKWSLALKEYISKSSICKNPHIFTHIHVLIKKNTEDKLPLYWNQNLPLNIGFHMNYNSSAIMLGADRKEGRKERRANLVCGSTKNFYITCTVSYMLKILY